MGPLQERLLAGNVSTTFANPYYLSDNCPALIHEDVDPDYKGTTWPVAWTWTYGKGRVFHTSLGHRRFGPNQPDPLQNPNLAKLILQGIDWAANQPATPAPAPAEKPKG